MRLELIRHKDNGVQTIGTLSIWDEDLILFTCKTLELPYKDNAKNISCIPEGKYPVKHRESKKYGKHLHIQKVPNRTYILMHSANFFHQLEGCIAVGKEFMHIDDDQQIDINASKLTLKRIVSLLETDEEHKIVIKDKIMMDKKQLFSSIKKGAKEGLLSFSLNIGKNKADGGENPKGKLNKPRLIAMVISQVAKYFLAYKGVEFIAPEEVDVIVNGILGLF